MGNVTASAAGRFKIGERSFNRLGFGAMRITGEGIWGPPADRAAAISLLKRLLGLGVDFIDTADAYGPSHSETLIKRALAPLKRQFVATKGGLVRNGPGIWLPVGRPEYLRQCVLMSMRRLDVERIDLWQLHRIDPKVPRDEQFDVMAEMQKEGLIANLGLSEVSVEDIESAGRRFKVATVQNRYNLVDRTSEAVLEHCEAHGIGFIPWHPLAAGDLAKQGSLLDQIATKTGATAGQIALAWVLKRSPVMLPIPGTSSVKHLEENVAAAGVTLSDDDFRALDALGREAFHNAA